MSSDFGQRLDDITQTASKALHSIESRLSGLAAAATAQQHIIESERSTVQREREEIDIEYSLSLGSSQVVESPDSSGLRRRESSLTEQAIRAHAMHRQLADFSAFMGSAARRFEVGEALPDAEEANQSEIRSAAFAAQEQERQRLAREIHDGPAQALANGIVALEFVERAIRASSESGNERALDEVERIKGSLRDGLTEIRRFIFDLRPTMLQDRGLPQTVEHYIATYQSVFPMAIEYSAPPRIYRLTPDQELTAFRIIQEAIQNARTHARASIVAVSISCVESVLRVSVRDDGRGFSPERITSHLMSGAGIKGMQERAALIGGTLSIESFPGEGTCVTLEAPILDPTAVAEVAFSEVDDPVPEDTEAATVTNGAETVEAQTRTL